MDQHTGCASANVPILHNLLATFVCRTLAMGTREPTGHAGATLSRPASSAVTSGSVRMIGLWCAVCHGEP
jgi:hypothetical protein